MHTTYFYFYSVTHMNCGLRDVSTFDKNDTTCIYFIIIFSKN